MKFNRLLLLEAAKKIAILNGMPEKAPTRRIVGGKLGAYFPQPEKSGMVVRLDTLHP